MADSEGAPHRPLRDPRPRRDADAQPARPAEHDRAGDDARRSTPRCSARSTTADVRVIRLRGAGRSFCAGYDIDWGAEMMGKEPSPWDPIRDYQVMSSYVDSLHVAVALAQAGDRAGARLLRRRRHRLRAVLGPDRVRGGLPHRLPARAGVGLADDRDVDVPDRARAHEAAAADRRPGRRPHRGRLGTRVGDRAGRRSSTRRRSRSRSASRRSPPTSST